jgi:oligopeptide/dipeptide ABC transporter ATP-binding protein
VTVQAEVLDLLEELQQSHGTALLLITHDMGVVAESADDVVVMYAGQIVEQAPALELFDRPEHPYTEALLGALPQIEDARARERRLTAIPGRPPDLVDPPETCRYAARCSYAGMDGCTNHMPELRELRPGHFVRSDHPASERAARREPVSA